MQAIPSFKRDKTTNKTFYCFDINNSDYDSPMSQYLAELGMSSLPIIAPNFFMDNKVLSDNLLHEMSCYIAEKPSEISAPTGITTDVCQPVGAPQHSTSPYFELSPPFFQSTLPDDFFQLPTGMKIVDIDAEDEWFHSVQDHAIICGHPLSKVEKAIKWGFELFDKFECMHCGGQLPRQPGGDGKQRSAMNRKIALAMYVAGVNPNQVLEICAQAGIVSPTENNLHKIYGDQGEHYDRV
jgi:hypothetical protein